MRIVIFLCSLQLLVLQAVPREVADPHLDVRPPAGFKTPEGARHTRSSGSEDAVKNIKHAPELLHFSENTEGGPQPQINNIRDNPGKTTRQPDTVLKMNKLPNLDGLTMEQIKQKYGSGESKPQPKARNLPPGMDKDQVFPALPRPPIGSGVAKEEH